MAILKKTSAAVLIVAFLSNCLFTSTGLPLLSEHPLVNISKSYTRNNVPVINFQFLLPNPIVQLKEAFQEALIKAFNSVVKQNPLATISWDMAMAALKKKQENPPTQQPPKPAKPEPATATAAANTN